MLLIPHARSQRANAKAVATENAKHHVYGKELLADGFVSPIVLASDRLKELRGDMDLQSFAAYTGLSEFELEYLFSNEYMEPTESQLMTISNKTGKSIMWLLGYHVPPESHLFNGDNEIIVAIGKRNSAEDSLRRLPAKGVINGLIRSNMEKRIEETTKRISFAAARIVARLHYPMDNRDIMWMKGQPVYIEFAGADPEDGIWGISIGLAIITEKGKLLLDKNGTDFCVYQTPKF